MKLEYLKFNKSNTFAKQVNVLNVNFVYNKIRLFFIIIHDLINTVNPLFKRPCWKHQFHWFFLYAVIINKKGKKEKISHTEDEN